jgi:hypothetical protein
MDIAYSTPVNRIALSSEMTRSLLALFEIVAVRRAEGKSINPFEVANLLQSLWAKSGFSFKRMKNDAFEKVAEGHILEFGCCFEYLQNSALHAYARLDSLDHHFFGMRHSNKDTTVHLSRDKRYIDTKIETEKLEAWRLFDRQVRIR